MSYLDSPHYQEACRRLAMKKKCRTELGRFWNHREFIAQLKAMVGSEPVTCPSSPVTTRKECA